MRACVRACVRACECVHVSVCMCVCARIKYIRRQITKWETSQQLRSLSTNWENIQSGLESFTFPRCPPAACFWLNLLHSSGFYISQHWNQNIYLRKTSFDPTGLLPRGHFLVGAARYDTQFGAWFSLDTALHLYQLFLVRTWWAKNDSKRHISQVDF